MINSIISYEEKLINFLWAERVYFELSYKYGFDEESEYLTFTFQSAAFLS